MDLESRVQTIEVETKEFRRALDDLKADHDELRKMAIELAGIKKDISYVIDAQTKVQGIVSKIFVGIFIAIAVQVVGFAMNGGFALS